MLLLALPVWEAASVSCCRFELIVRLFAGTKHPAASVTSEIRGTKGLLEIIFADGGFEPHERVLLERCARVRNKLLHCEPDALLAVLQEVDPTFNPPRAATQIRLGENSSGAEVLEAITSRRDAVDVQDTRSREDGFFGWMLEAAATGIFAKAIQVLESGIVLLLQRDPAA